MQLNNFILDTRGDIMLVTLNRPPVNALNTEVLEEMEVVLDSIHDTSALRAVILTGAGDVFSAGADLKERREMTDSEVKQFVKQIKDLFFRWYSIEIPTICAINGGAFGGGLELALMCDFRICSESATLGFPESRLAIIPGAGGTQRLARLAGESIAFKWILTGKRFHATEALEDRILDQVHPQDAVLDAANELAFELCQAAPIAIREAKRAIRSGLQLSYREGLVLESECYDRTIPTRDRNEALAAFNEKREPDWTGS